MPYIILVVIVWALDRVSKMLVVNRFPLWSSTPIIDHWFTLTHVQNTGAAFGILQGQVVLLVLVDAALLLSLYFFRRQIDSLGLGGKIGIALVFGGALGNLYDRLVFGYVIDFLELPIIPVFNLADSAIVLGVGLLMLGIWNLDRRDRQNASA